MKIINATQWSTEALEAAVQRALSAPEFAKRRTGYTEVCFKPTNYSQPIHSNESKVDRHRVEVLLWNPAKFKVDMDKLTLMAASTGDHGFIMPPPIAAQLLIGLEQALRSGSINTYEIANIAKRIKDPPIIPERLAEEGRIDDAVLQIEIANDHLDRLRKAFGAKERSLLGKLDKLQKSIDFNKKKLEKMKKQEKSTSARSDLAVSGSAPTTQG